MEQPTLTANLMTKKPISGEYLERQFSCSVLINTWVLFSGKDFKSWVGVFGNGTAPYFSSIAKFDGTNIFLIIAGGQGYIIDAMDGRLLLRTKWNYAYSCFTVPGHPFVLVASNIEVCASYIEKDVLATLQQLWCTYFDKLGHKVLPEPAELHRIALDGIVFDGIKDGFLSGKSWWSEGWHSFRIDITYMSAVIGKDIISSQWDAFVALLNVGGFPMSQEYIKRMSAYRVE